MSDDDRREELRRFLKDRRARLRPSDAGLPPTPRRRVAGLRREEVAALANIGVSWYTALESGDARRVSDATLLAVADALRLSESEREYLFGLAGRFTAAEESEGPSQVVLDAMMAMSYPAYVITATWQIVACNAAFRVVWNVGDHELPFDAVARLFIDPAARRMHGTQFAANISPIVAMVRSGIGRHPNLAGLRDLRDRLLADAEARRIWDDFEVSGPTAVTRAEIASPIGTFSYEALTLPIEGALHGIVVQVPDIESRARLAHALRRARPEPHARANETAR
jgi:transcriptional regulator with XRE-family HTH domain